MEQIVLAMAGIYFLSHLFAAIFSRTRIPDVLLLTLMGLIIGPFTGSATRADFGVVGDVLSHIALVVILFEGGVTIRMAKVRKVLGNALLLTVLTFALTTLVVAHATVQFLNFDLFTGLLTGVILGGVSPAIVIPLAKGLGLTDEGFAILSIECALSDVLAVVLALSFLTSMQSGHIDPLHIGGDVLLEVAVGAVIGMAGGVVWLSLLSTMRAFPHSTLTTIGFLLLLSAVTDIVGFSGAITAFFFGLTLANYHELLDGRVSLLRNFNFTSITQSEHTVFQELIFILKTFFFVYLGISITVRSRALLIACGIVLVVALLRILVTRASLPRRLGWQELAVMSQMFPKGLAAAVLAGLPLEYGLPQGHSLRAVVYSTMLVAIVWTTLLVPLIERTRFGFTFKRALSAPAES